jgi:hypothetical protein
MIVPEYSEHLAVEVKRWIMNDTSNVRVISPSTIAKT